MAEWSLPVIRIARPKPTGQDARPGRLLSTGEVGRGCTRTRPGADVQTKHQMTDKVSQSVSGTRPNEQVSAGDHQVVEVMQQDVRLEFGGRDFGVAEVDQD
jgi:methyl coenzyme M reductase subunit C-like uncharacterized protein (methanogenesis marker protein 7)